MNDNGIVIYDGPSEIDKKPITAIAVGLNNGGSNSKTGPMVQVYIMVNGMNPGKAAHTVAYVSICGYCVHRGTI